MPDEIQGQEEQVLEETQETTQEQETPEEVSTSEQPTDSIVESELPEDAKERTRREFEKLKQHNAELKKQLEEKERKEIPSVLDFLNQPSQPVMEQTRQQYIQPVQMPQLYPQPQMQAQPEPQLIDEQGYLNADVLKKELEELKLARLKSEEAERRAREASDRVARFEIDSETQKLYTQYPELDPQSEVFDKEAYDLVKNELTSQIINSGRRDAIKAADKMSKYFRTQPQQQAKTQQVLEQRKQVASPGVAPRQQSTEDLDDLKKRSRNDPNAVAERLRRLGM